MHALDSMRGTLEPAKPQLGRLRVALPSQASLCEIGPCAGREALPKESVLFAQVRGLPVHQSQTATLPRRAAQRCAIGRHQSPPPLAHSSTRFQTNPMDQGTSLLQTMASTKNVNSKKNSTESSNSLRYGMSVGVSAYISPTTTRV